MAFIRNPLGAVVALTVSVLVLAGMKVEASVATGTSNSTLNRMDDTVAQVQATRQRQHAWISATLVDRIFDYNVTSTENPSCTTHFQIYRQHLRNFTTWAVQMFDSSDLYPSGFFVGDSYKLGNFDGCIDVQIPQTVGIAPQYCLSTFKFSRSKPPKMVENIDEWESPAWNRIQITDDPSKVPKNFFKLAFCLPKSCSPKDLESSLQTLLEGPMRAASYQLNVTVDELECTSKESIPEPLGTTVMKNLIICLTVIALFSTAVDLFLAVAKPDEYNITNFSLSNASGIGKWLMPFSIARNYNQLMTPSASPDEYNILHGFKVLLMICVMQAHRLVVGANGLNLANWKYFEDSIYGFNIFFVGLPMTDLFLCMAGFLGALGLIKQFQRNSFNLRIHVANKLIRTLPPYMFVIACTIYILPYIGNGPLWKTLIEPEVGPCRKNWWTNVLFINNYYDKYEHCLFNSWYLAADMHFFIVGTILVSLCCRWRNCKIFFLSLGLFLSAFFPFCTVIFNRYSGMMRMFYPDFLLDSRSGQISFLEGTNLAKLSHNRFGSYIIGVIAAFLLDHLKKNNQKFTKTQVWAGGFLGIALVCLTAGYGQVFYPPSRPYHAIEHALYAALHNQLIATGFMIIVIIQITTGFGVLSHLCRVRDFFVAISRLMYWISILNVPIFLYIVGSFRTTQYMTYEQMIYGGQCWGDLLLVLFVSFYCHFIIDAPINHMRPIILNYIKRSQSQPHTKRE